MQSSTNTSSASNYKKLFILAWVLGLIYYFIVYATRSAPSLMINELAALYEIDNQSIISVVGSYYMTYSICALVAGVCLDKFGAKYSLFAGAFILGIGCILFILSSQTLGYTGRLLQGAGSAFAFPGSVYLIAKGFSSKHLATAIGVTQCVGMLGGAAGQFVVAPMLQGGLSVSAFWIYAGISCIVPAILMLVLIPKSDAANSAIESKTTFIKPFKIVFSNKDSWLSGIISGLLFAPTTIFFMTWSVKFFVTDLNVSALDAPIVASMAALGWVAGCPLMGFISDRIGRKPVILIGCVGMILMLLQLIYLNHVMDIRISVFAFGVFSGVAMIPYSIIKEVNPDNVKGSATGVQNFITFGVTNAVGPLFAKYHGFSMDGAANHTTHFNQAIWFWIVGILLALILTLFVTETVKKEKNKV